MQLLPLPATADDAASKQRRGACRRQLAAARAPRAAVAALALPLLLLLAASAHSQLSEWSELRRASADCAALRAAGALPHDAIPVLLPAAGRPAYLSLTLAALARARGGAGSTVLISSQDGEDAAVAALLAGAPPGLKLEPFRPSRFA